MGAKIVASGKKQVARWGDWVENGGGKVAGVGGVVEG